MISGKDRAALSLGQRMLQAQFPHGVENLKLVETHISWVILTGAYAYKLKKPLQLDFLDYSSIEKRLESCGREVEINRGWAPEIYQGVVPVFCGAAGIRVGQVGEQSGPQEHVIDYAVRMQQFPQSALLSAQLKAKAVTPNDMEQLADDLVALHQRSGAAEHAPELVQRAAVDPALDNFRHFRASLCDHDPNRPAIERLEAWTRRTIDDLLPRMHQRARDGYRRNCHGDLHLENLLYLDGKFVPFDGIEFSDALRQVDVLSELAFLAMELTEHGYAAHAHAMVNRYLEATEDYAGLGVFRFYLVYRAMVRAKVDLIRQQQRGDQNNPDAGNGVATTTFSPSGKQYILYAQRVMTPSTARLWITYGPSGSGKSVVAKSLVHSRGAIRLRSDVVRKRLGGFDPLTRPPTSQLATLYGEEMTQRTYRRLLQWTRDVLDAGFSVIVDATFLQRAQRAPFRELAQQDGVPFSILLCDAPPDELRRRILARRADPSDATIAVLDAQLASAEPPSGDELPLVVPQQEFAREAEH